MSGSAKAGTTAERHKCELRMLANADVRAPPKRASGGLRFPLTKTYMDVGNTEVGWFVDARLTARRTVCRVLVRVEDSFTIIQEGSLAPAFLLG